MHLKVKQVAPLEGHDDDHDRMVEDSDNNHDMEDGDAVGDTDGDDNDDDEDYGEKKHPRQATATKRRVAAPRKATRTGKKGMKTTREEGVTTVQHTGAHLVNIAPAIAPSSSSSSSSPSSSSIILHNASTPTTTSNATLPNSSTTVTTTTSTTTLSSEDAIKVILNHPIKKKKKNKSILVPPKPRKSTAGAPRIHHCIHCEKSFARRSDLQRHVRTHLNDK